MEKVRNCGNCARLNHCESINATLNLDSECSEFSLAFGRSQRIANRLAHAPGVRYTTLEELASSLDFARTLKTYNEGSKRRVEDLESFAGEQLRRMRGISGGLGMNGEGMRAEVGAALEDVVKAKDREIADLKEQVASLQRALAVGRDEALEASE